LWSIGQIGDRGIQGVQENFVEMQEFKFGEYSPSMNMIPFTENV
jgi:hypothetical protein